MFSRVGCVVIGASVLLGAGCSSSSSSDSSGDEEVKYDYGGTEMRGAIEGSWEGTSRASGGADTPMKLTLIYSAPQVKPRCGTRVLGLAPTCIDMSSINITGNLTADAARDVPASGSFDVMSLRFDGSGLLNMTASGRVLDATLTNGVLEGTLRAESETTGATFSLRRK